MRIRVLGGGWYGCHLASALRNDGHEVALHEIADRLFSGASGSNPARLHVGFHYPRSHLTRALCQEHHDLFMRSYGDLTRTVPINLYAVAAHDSMVDFGTYKQVLRNEVEFVTVEKPAEFGLRNVEGALLTGERHIVIGEARDYFSRVLSSSTVFNCPPGQVDDSQWDVTIDCTFCAMDAENIDRYEPCVTGILRGPTDKAVTIMDGPFPSIYPWDEEKGLSSLTSAKFTPLAKCRSWEQARGVLRDTPAMDIEDRVKMMLEQIEYYWPEARQAYEVVDVKLGIRAMPKSAAAARFVDVVRVGERGIRVRAGKIDAIFHAEMVVKELIQRITR